MEALDLDDAVERILDQLRPIATTESVPLAEACGRVLAESIRPGESIPPFANSAMDGYAYRHADQDTKGAPFTLRIVGRSLAGHPFAGRVDKDECVRIMTGAVLPDGADTVVAQETTRTDGPSDLVSVLTEQPLGANVRAAGSDVVAGTEVLPLGRTLDAFAIGAAAACGVEFVRVYRPVRVGLFSTGDELTSPGRPLEPGHIYDSNRALIRALIRTLPIEVTDYGVIADDADRIRAVLDTAAHDADLIVTSGGVSVGDADYVTQTVESLGALDFWRINMKPGKPLAFGRVGNSAFLGLPGNPVSTAVTALLFVIPAIQRLSGGHIRPLPSLEARLATPMAHKPGREEFQRGVVRYDNGCWVVSTDTDQGSNRLAALARANCLVRIPKQSGDVPAGTIVRVIPLEGLTR